MWIYFVLAQQSRVRWQEVQGELTFRQPADSQNAVHWLDRVTNTTWPSIQAEATLWCSFKTAFKRNRLGCQKAWQVDFFFKHGIPSVYYTRGALSLAAGFLGFLVVTSRLLSSYSFLLAPACVLTFLLVTLTAHSSEELHSTALTHSKVHTSLPSRVPHKLTEAPAGAAVSHPAHIVGHGVTFTEAHPRLLEIWFKR